MNDLYCIILSNFLGDDVMGYISHQKFLSSWILGFCNTMKSEVRYCLMHCGFFICVLLLMSLLDSTIFSCRLLSRRPDLAIFCMLLLCLLFFPLSQDASPPVFSMDIFNSSTSKFVTSVEFSKASSQSNITRLQRVFFIIQCYWYE